MGDDYTVNSWKKISQISIFWNILSILLQLRINPFKLDVILIYTIKEVHTKKVYLIEFIAAMPTSFRHTNTRRD